MSGNGYKYRGNGYKYRTLAELKAAYDSGKLSRDCPVIIDNDNCDVYEEILEDENGILVDSSVKVFECGMPEDLLEQALDLLGIPHEPA